MNKEWFEDHTSYQLNYLHLHQFQICRIQAPLCSMRLSNIEHGPDGQPRVSTDRGPRDAKKSRDLSCFIVDNCKVIGVGVIVAFAVLLMGVSVVYFILWAALIRK